MMKNVSFRSPLQCTEPWRNLRKDIDVSNGNENHVSKRIEGAEYTGSILGNLDDEVDAFRDRY